MIRCVHVFKMCIVKSGNGERGEGRGDGEVIMLVIRGIQSNTCNMNEDREKL